MNKQRISLAGLAVALVLFFAVNMASGALLRGARLDLTENGLYTLSEGTENILATMDEEVTLRFYFSRGLATDYPDLKRYAQRVVELLEEYTSRAGTRLRLFVSDPEPFSEEEDRAVAYGMQGVPVNAAGELLYFGLSGTNSTDEEEVIPFFQVGREEFLEYDLTKLIYNLAFPEKKVVGLLSTLPVEGGPFNPMNPQAIPEPWLIVDQIRQAFEVRTLQATATEIPAEVDILMLVHPQGLSPQLLYSIDQFVLGGGRLLAFVDPHCEVQQVPQDPNNQLAALTADRTSDLGPLLAAWGVELADQKIVGDRLNAQRVVMGNQPIEYVAWLHLGEGEVNGDDPVTSNLTKEINMATVGALRALPDASTSFTPIIDTSSESMEIDRMQVALQPNPTSLLESFLPGGSPLTVAARVSGPTTSAYPDGPPESEDAPAEEEAVTPHRAASERDINVVLIADADMLEDRWWVNVQNFFGNRIAIPSANNADLVINVLDNLSGSNDLISLRSRARFNRPFDRVAEIRRVAEDRFRNKEQELEQRLRETEEKINELQSQKEGGVSAIILSPEQQAEIEAFRAERLGTRKELRDVKHQLKKDIERLGSQLKLLNIFVLPLALPALIALLAMMRSRARSV
ncbi:MAG: Gldg family protein [Planctomycetota bacterium]|nr:Gldg family protein [Planctomycetota bacterium]